MNRMLFHLKHPLQPLLDYYIVVERVLRKQLNSNQNVKFGSFLSTADEIRLVTRVQRGSTVLQFRVCGEMDFWFHATTFQKLFSNGRVSCSIIRQIILSVFRLLLTIEFGNTRISVENLCRKTLLDRSVVSLTIEHNYFPISNFDIVDTWYSRIFRPSNNGL